MSMMSRPQDSTEFDGGAFDPGLPGGTATGTVRVEAGEVRFESIKGGVALPLEGLDIRIGGASGRMILFSHSRHPDRAIHTEDHGILRHGGLEGHPTVRKEVRTMRARSRLGWGVMGALVLLVVGLPLGVLLSKDRLVRAAVKSIPVAWEVSFGEALFAQVRGRGRIIETPAVERGLAQLTRPLVDGMGEVAFPLHFHLMEDPTLNAFALPGGHVVLHTGLVLAADRPEEVAGVLAHEIAHAQLRHGFQSVVSSVGLAVLVRWVVGDLGGMLGVVGEQSAFLLDQKFSRDFEREADEVGWGYLEAARIDPRGLITFFGKMEEEAQRLAGGAALEKAQGAITLLSTHPATAERIARIEEKLRRLPAGKSFREFDCDYGAFKAAVRAEIQKAPAR